MTALSATPARRRGAFVALPALIAALLAPLGFAAPVSAATIVDGSDSISSGFEIEGNKDGDGTEGGELSFDWNDILTVPGTGTAAYDFTPTGPYETADEFDSSGITDAIFFWDNGIESAACLAQGAEASGLPSSQSVDTNPWVPGSATVNSKADGCSAAAAYEVIVDDDGLEHHMLYQYWTRLEREGDMSTYQTLEGVQPGRCDDFLVEFNYDSDGPDTTVIIYSWKPKKAGDCDSGDPGTWIVVDGDFPHDAAIGARVEGPGATPADPGEDETFGEIAIDLTLADLFDDDACVAFQASGFVTRTGNSAQAQLQDYVYPQDESDFLTISNCGSITVRKAALPDTASSNTAFEYVIENESETNDAHDSSLEGTSGGVNPVALTDSTPLDYGQIGSSLTIGTKHTWSGVFAGSYQLSETIPLGAPWALASMVCEVKNPTTGQTETVNGLVNGVLTGIPVYTSTTTDCVITNATSQIVIEKTSVGGTGTFGFDLTGDTTPEATIDTASATTTAPISYAPGSQVTITELLGAVNGAVDPDWALNSISCTGDESVNGSSVSVTTVAGQQTICTFTNERKGSISITKTTVGAAGSFQFALQRLDQQNAPVGEPELAAANVLSAGGSATASFPNVVPGTRYSLAEVAPGASWIVGALTCTVTPFTGGTPQTIDVTDFVVNPGDSIACAITNTKTGTIVVVKNVAGANGTFDFTRSWPAPDTAFTLTTTEPTDSDSEAFSNLVPGPYTVAELAEPGYDGTVSCTDESAVVTELSAALTLDAGETITCTWTNTERGTLVVVKETTTESEQTFDFEWAPVGEAATDFDLADGGSYSTTLPPGDYTVTELSLEGWALIDLVCIDGEDEPTGSIDDSEATVAIASGETVTCTYTNAERGDLTFDKSVKSGPVYSGNGQYTITYELVVESDSNIAELYDLEDELDFGDGIDVVSASVVGPIGVDLESDWDGEDHTRVATGAEIPALGKHTYTITVVVDPPALITSAVADCTASEAEGTGLLNRGGIAFWGEGSDTDTACAVVPISDLAITKGADFSVDFEPAKGPTSIKYTITVTNLGPDTAYDVVITDPLIDDNLDFVSASGDGAVCGFNTTTRTVACDLGVMIKNATRTVTIIVSIPADYPIGQGVTSLKFDNVATTSTVTPESDLTNNVDAASTSVTLTLAFPPTDPPGNPELPTLALTGAAIGFATQLGLGLLAVGLALAVTSLRRRRLGGRHTA